MYGLSEYWWLRVFHPVYGMYAVCKIHLQSKTTGFIYFVKVQHVSVVSLVMF